MTIRSRLKSSQSNYSSAIHYLIEYLQTTHLTSNNSENITQDIEAKPLEPKLSFIDVFQNEAMSAQDFTKVSSKERITSLI